jgi:hypothetical protein
MSDQVLDDDLDEDKKDQPTVKDVVADAKLWMGSYFSDKPYYCGGSIPHHILYNQKRINLVLDCTFDHAMDIAHEALEKNLTDEDWEYIDAGGVGPDIKSLISVLHSMSDEKVPQEYSPGMLVVYLELCMGLDVAY